MVHIHTPTPQSHMADRWRSSRKSARPGLQSKDPKLPWPTPQQPPLDPIQERLQPGSICGHHC